MADLFRTLGSISRALDAQRYGLQITGHNIANVNTPGYAKRVVDLVALAPESPESAGRGVDVQGVRAMRDRLLEARLYNELPAETREAAVAEALSVVEAAVGTPGASIDANLERFFDAFATLADMPTSAVSRDNVLVQGEALAAAFRNMSGRLASAGLDADRQVRGTVEEINVLLERIAALNVTIGNSPVPEQALHAQDDQAALVRDLAKLVDIRVLNREEGGVDITVGQGRPIIVGQTTYPLEVQNAAVTGYAEVRVGGNTITSEISGGRLGGFLQVRDTNIPDYVSRLDALAYSVATEVNTLHGAGFNQLGAAGGTFFDFSTPPVGTAGAAAALIVRPAVAADARLVAASGTAEAGDNGAAREIANLRSTRVLNGATATLSDGWGQFVYRVARDAQSAANEQASRAEIVRQVDALRDAVSGVSLDEEAMEMLKFQRAYEANARFFQVVDGTIETLLSLAGR